MKKSKNNILNIESFFNGEFWFSEEKDIRRIKDSKYNVADKKILSDEEYIESNFRHGDVTDFYNKNSKLVDKRDLAVKSQKDFDKAIYNRIKEDLEENMSLEEQELKARLSAGAIGPHGYVPLEIVDTNVNELFIKHNITLKYITADGKNYIKSILLVSDDRELDCYSLGENILVSIKKLSDSLLSISVFENTGKNEMIHVVNGRVI